MSRFIYFVRETWISLRRNLLMTLAGIITVTVSLALFGGILLVQRVVDHGTSRWKDGVELEIFMDVDATASQVGSIRDELAAERDLVREFRYLSKDDAYREFQRIFQDQPDLVENVDPESLPADVEVTHVNLNDQTVEGLRHRRLPVFSVQYHPEAAAGPHDSVYLFDEFVRIIDAANRG